MILGLGNTIPSDSIRQGLGGGGGGGFTNTYSLTFDGVDDFVKTSLDGTSTGGILPASDSDIELTISFWFYMDGSQSLKGIFQWGNSLIDTTPTLLVNTDGASIRTFVDGSYRHTSGITMNAWHHYAITRTASTNTWQGYIDGVSAFTANDGGTLNDRASATDFYFGVGYNGYLNGKIDEAAFWNSVQDVAAIYNSGVPNDLTSLNPTTWYRMGDNGSYKSPQWLIPNNSNVANSRISNYSLQLDGVDDYVDVGELLQLSNATALTVSLWFNAASSGTNNKIILDFKEGTSRVTVQRIGSQIYLYVNNKNSIYNVATSLDTWYHLAYVFDGTGATDADRLKLYINGAEISASSFSGTIPTSIGAFTPGFMKCKIGSLYNNASPSTYNWVGKLDEIAVFLSAKSSSDITSIYNSGTPTTITGATAYWKMGEEANFTSNWLVNNSALSNYSTRSFNFDGVDDRVECGALTNIVSSAPYSVSLWFKQSGSGNEFLISGGPTGAGQFNASIYLRPADNQIWLDGSTAAQKWNWSNVNNDWQHLLFVDAGGGTYKLYSNGVSETLSSVTTYLGAQADLWIGARTSGNHFDGEIDEVAFFNSDVSGDIAALYNSGIPADLTSLSPVSWYRMGEDATFNTNWSLPDNGSASNTGTSANMTIADLEGNAPNYTGGGLSANMTINDRIGDAPNSTSNALSYNMTESDRVEDTPPS